MVVDLRLARTRLAGMPDAQNEDQGREQGDTKQLDEGRQGACWLAVREGCRKDLGGLPMALGSAPLSSNAAATLAWPLWAASTKALAPSGKESLASAPADSSSLDGASERKRR